MGKPAFLPFLKGFVGAYSVSHLLLRRPTQTLPANMNVAILLRASVFTDSGRTTYLGSTRRMNRATIQLVLKQAFPPRHLSRAGGGREARSG